MHTWISWGKRKERSHLEDLGINERIISVLICGCKAVTTVGFCEHGIELLNVGGYLKS